MKRKRLFLLILSTALLLLIFIPCRMTWLRVRQSRLDRSLIAALQEDGGSEKDALAVLQAGADPNASEVNQPPLTAWQQLLRVLHRTPSALKSFGYQRGERSALVLAVANEKWSAAKVLLQYGAKDVDGAVYLDDGRGAEEFSLLDEAIRGNNEVALMLLERGADPNIESVRGSRPIGAAVVEDNLPMVTELVRHGANINLGGYRRVPPLIEGAGKSSPALLRFLLEHGADSNAQYILGPQEYREYGYTALAEARKRKDGLRDETVRLLRQFGAKR